MRRDLERVRGEWRTTGTDRTSRTLLIENVMLKRKFRKEKSKKRTVTVAILTPDDRHNKTRTTSTTHTQHYKSIMDTSKMAISIFRNTGSPHLPSKTNSACSEDN